jgi:hypothetical protein
MPDCSPQGSAPGHSNHWLARVGTALVPDDNPSAVIYGLLTTGALLAAESTRRETMAEAVVASAITLLLYWLAHSYARALSDRLESADRWSGGQLLRTAVHEAALLKGAAVPLVVLVAAALIGTGPANSVLAALVATALLLFTLELIAGLRARLSGLALAGEAVVGAALGLGVILLKVVIH